MLLTYSREYKGIYGDIKDTREGDILSQQISWALLGQLRLNMGRARFAQLKSFSY